MALLGFPATNILTKVTVKEHIPLMKYDVTVHQHPTELIKIAVEYVLC